MNADAPQPNPDAPPAPASGVAGSAAPAGPAPDPARLLEARLVRMENYLGFRPLTPADAEAILTGLPPPTATGAAPGATDEGLEEHIGEFWLARVGVIALIVGLSFLVVYPFAGLPAYLPSLIGYAAAGGFFALARRWERTLADTSRILFSGALFLLYFATLRLNFFSAQPAVPSRALVLGLVLAVHAAQYAVAVRRDSELTAMLAAALVAMTGIVADTPNFSLAVLAAAAGVAVWLYRGRHWWKLGLVTTALVYTAHLNWLLGNPLAGHPVRAMAEPHWNLLFLALHGGAFVSAGLLRPQESEADVLRILRAVAASGGLIVLALLNAQLYHRGQLPWVQLGLAAGFLVTANAYWLHHRGRYGPAIYACFGYLALSAGIMAWAPSPAVYSWLAWQSLLVAATAVWFQSKIVIVANLFIFGGIYLAYLLMAPAAGGVNLSFAVVALLIARILNWQKERLSLRTEFMRNVYLAAATVIIPYGLYHTVPKSLVSTSWLLAAGGYFVASLLLGSRKYRWMAMATIFATIGYVFVVDLSRLQPAYRIVSFLVLGVVLIGFSIFYARQRAKGGGGDSQPGQEN
ncbi:MAG: hypothetical protein C0502_05150 [Opitutus sp.]|nr:hypothetical protein [Opitutus sp.]